MATRELWDRFCDRIVSIPALQLSVDTSRIAFPDGFMSQMEPRMQSAFLAMDQLEKGAIANPDENRMVGHYWLRAPDLAPTAEIQSDIRSTLDAIRAFAADVHSGRIHPPKAARFRSVLSIGIGGSALGPQFVADALGNPGRDAMSIQFIDNTDPDGMARTLASLTAPLAETLVLVISKSGGTPEPRNGMLVVADAFRAAGLDFAKQAVAITGQGSQLDKQAESQGWLRRFPMWDWVGGRTSELGPVGLVPAALQGINIDELLAGAAMCDVATRSHATAKNPAAILALAWYQATGGTGAKDMVVLPYKDRLLLFSRYLQQLVMESLGKRLDRNGKRVDQGIAVYGNKGSTDQHAYVQQLRDGINNFFAVFVRVLEDGGAALDVEPGIHSGDYLHGFLLGTRKALFENDRQSVMITVPRIDAKTVGGLIALFERAVGLYASLVGINAYHQPGVEAGKKAASEVLNLQSRLLDSLTGQKRTAEQIAPSVDPDADIESVFLLLEHLSANGRVQSDGNADPRQRTFWRLNLK